MAYLELIDINKRFDGRRVLENINLLVEQGSFVSLLGQSGCGKTTLLRIIAGLERADSGQILLNGKDITKVPPQQRNIGIVFQNYALFPHLRVSENIAYGLNIRKLPAADIERKVNAVLDKVGLSHKAQQNVSSLSGGEQQRVALARAIVIEPRILLLDEPLSNLDHSLRVLARNELKRLQNELGITSIYVTHDQSEALALSDQISVLSEGKIMQSGTPQALYRNPANTFTAQFVGRYNLFYQEESSILLSHDLPTQSVLCVLPEHVTLCRKTTDNPLQIKDVLFVGMNAEFILAFGDRSYKSIQSAEKAEAFRIGEMVSISVSEENKRILPC